MKYDMEQSTKTTVSIVKAFTAQNKNAPWFVFKTTSQL